MCIFGNLMLKVYLVVLLRANRIIYFILNNDSDASTVLKDRIDANKHTHKLVFANTEHYYTIVI